MKSIILFIGIVCSLHCLAQTPTIKFDYDDAGNQTKRYMQIVSLRMSNPNKPQDSSLVFNVYPNPTQDYITIEGDLENGANQASVFIYDLKGAIVQKDIYYGTKKTYSLTGYTTGIYFLEIKYSTKQSSNYRILITQ